MAKTEKKTDSTKTEELDYIDAIVVNCHQLNIRKKPDLGAVILCVLNVGDYLEIAETEDPEWVAVVTTDGVEGFAMKEFVEEA